MADDDFLAVMAGLDPWTAVPLGRPYDEKSVRGYDVTASAPKSVSVLWAVGDDQTRAEVLDAHDTAVVAMVGWIEAHAHTRRRIGGQVCMVDADGIVAAAFRQHTSRALDPQLHTHVVLANRVRSDDGRWLALDARTIMLDQRTLSALYHSTLRSELTRRLGVGWRPVEHGIAEIDHIPVEVLASYSTRTVEVLRRIDEKLDRFTATMGRDPTPKERWRLEREAVIDSRPAKAHGVDAAALHAVWIERLHTLGQTPDQLQDSAIGREVAAAPASVDRDLLIAGVFDALEAKQSSWRPAEITRELAALLPPLALPAAEIVELLEQLTAGIVTEYCVDLSRPVPDGVALRRDGRPISESVADRVLTTVAILAQEQALLDWAQRRHDHPGVIQPAAIDRADVALSGPQAEVAAAVAGTAKLVLVVGPAGTGKTTALAPAVAQLHADGRVAFGVAPSAAAAKVLAAETGVAADTIDKLLTEYARPGGPRPPWHLAAGATLLAG